MKSFVKTVPVWLILTFYGSDVMAMATDPRVTYKWGTGSPFIRVDACERYGYEFCDVGMVAPDDLDCQYFYQCNQGHWQHQQCAPPTYFDVDTYLCQQQMFVTCQDECAPYTGAPIPDPGAEPRGKTVIAQEG